MCPVILELKKRKRMEIIVCLTGQHREMLKQVMIGFGVKEKYNLNIMSDKQTLTNITTNILKKLESLLILENPDMVLVHGDTTTSYAAALAAFYQRIPVGHIEAGLRTGNIYSPFPEEMNRMLTDRISTYHFAPTERNRDNLSAEGIYQNVYITGNTVIDAFSYTVKKEYHFHETRLNSFNYAQTRVILVTAHRRENLGRPLHNICTAISNLARECKDVVFVYPVHPNPSVRETVIPILQNIDNVFLIDPIDVFDMHNLLARCYMVMTDSGGLQEEAPHFGKPVLVLRNETERIEAVVSGTIKIVGIEERVIYQEAKRIIDDEGEYQRMAHAVNPYGDGHASEKIVDEIELIEGCS